LLSRLLILATSVLGNVLRRPGRLVCLISQQRGDLVGQPDVRTQPGRCALRQPVLRRVPTGGNTMSRVLSSRLRLPYGTSLDALTSTMHFHACSPTSSFKPENSHIQTRHNHTHWVLGPRHPCSGVSRAHETELARAIFAFDWPFHRESGDSE